MLALLRFCGALLGRVAFVLGIRRAVTLDNLRRAYPELSEDARKSVAKRAYSNLGLVFFEFPYLKSGQRSAIGKGLKLQNLEHVKEALSNPNGVVLVSGHLANWEWLALGLGLVIENKLNVIVKNQKSSFAERYLHQMRTRFGNVMIDAGEIRKVFRALKSGEVVGILGDQTAFSEAVRVPFFGMQVPTFEGTARLALQTGASVIFLQPLRRTASGYEWQFHNVKSDDLTGVTEENVRTLTARHTAMLEAAIREKPEFWVWQHRRFKYVQ